ncbi:MAG: HAMP domain-containing histidine kinase [Pirellulales bacterium]|nr:HAMP domain-containing histidine kinase [Pirellulales bacterium]
MENHFPLTNESVEPCCQVQKESLSVDRPHRASEREIEILIARHAREVASLRHDLLHAQKKATLGEMLSIASHEFNNSLTTIINYAKIGIRHKDVPTRDKALEKILSSGERAACISRSILTLSRKQSSRMEPVHLESLAEEVLVLLEREMMKYRVQVEREFVTVPRVMANPGQIHQVFLNLLTNARQAMPSGGRLIFKLAYDPSSDLVDCIIRDTGTGMTQEVLRRIFEPHFSTKTGPDDTGKGGAGLGLSACREIIEGHRGRIRVESKPGLGTAFMIRLPIAKAPVFTNVREPAEKVAVVPPALGTMRVQTRESLSTHRENRRTTVSTSSRSLALRPGGVAVNAAQLHSALPSPSQPVD